MRRNNGALLLGVGIGALLMFYLDPNRGARRRALVRDKAIRAGNSAAEFIDDRRRDLGNRLEGVKARVRRMRTTEVVDDVTLIERVRAQLGRYTTHAGNIDVKACDGEVTLCGRVDGREAKRVLRAVANVPGVCNVIDELDVDQTLPMDRGWMSVPTMLLVAAGAAVAARTAFNRSATM
jgi:osmotically-inducible protein OsmY